MTSFFNLQRSKSLPDRVQGLESRLAELERALEALDADLDWLTGDVKKLRGKVTGGERGKKNAQVDPQDTNGGDPDPKYLSPGWFAAQRKRLNMGGIP